MNPKGLSPRIPHAFGAFGGARAPGRAAGGLPRKRAPAGYSRPTPTSTGPELRTGVGPSASASPPTTLGSLGTSPRGPGPGPVVGRAPAGPWEAWGRAARPVRSTGIAPSRRAGAPGRGTAGARPGSGGARDRRRRDQRPAGGAGAHVGAGAGAPGSPPGYREARAPAPRGRCFRCRAPPPRVRGQLPVRVLQDEAGPRQRVRHRGCAMVRTATPTARAVFLSLKTYPGERAGLRPRARGACA